jgi:hypothetical protein
MILNRRGFIAGLISLVAAPAIVRVQSIMPVKAVAVELPPSPPLGPHHELIGVLKDSVFGDETYPGNWRLFGIPSSFEKDWDRGSKLYRGNFGLLQRTGLAGQSDYRLMPAGAGDEEPRQLEIRGDWYDELAKRCAE